MQYLVAKTVTLEELSKCGAATVIELNNKWDQLTSKGLSKDNIVAIASQGGKPGNQKSSR